MRGALAAMALGLAAARDAIGIEVGGHNYASGPSPKIAPTYSATQPRPLNKARRRAKAGTLELF